MTAQIIGHLANLIFAAAYLVRDIMWLRVLSIGGCLAAALFNYFAPASPLWVAIFWNILFIAMNVIWCVILWRERAGINFTEDEKELHATIFSGLSPLEFSKILRAGRWETYPGGTTLLRKGDQVQDVILIHNGSARVDRDSGRSITIRDGAFIGEMALSSGAPASATVSSSSELKAVTWSIASLKDLFERNPALDARFRSVVGSDLAQKLSRMT